MRWIAAPYLFPCNQPPVKNGILKCTDDGVILEIIKNEAIAEKANLEYYNGFLVPGFVNAHCHLELSHLQNKTQKGSGIGDFIGQVNKLRTESAEVIRSGIEKADRFMWLNGISVVGDISNSMDTCQVKKNSKIYYHTFVEAFGFLNSRAERAFENAQNVYNEFWSYDLSAGIVPHSPYSVSSPLMEKICNNARLTNSILSVHNQESEGENQFFKDKSGPIANHLKTNLGIDISEWNPGFDNPIETILKQIPVENRLLLVHNTFISKQDIHVLKNKRNMQDTFFVLCPNSNLYIENKVPPIQLFREENLNICIGTDSLASNVSLSVLDELKTIQGHYPELNVEELFSWGCINGAKALNADKRFGSFETGKQPGVNLITGVDLQNLKLTEKSTIKRLI